jgi:hypothetical protein
LPPTQFKHSIRWYAYALVLVFCLDDAEGINLPNLLAFCAKAFGLFTQASNNGAAAKSLIHMKASEMLHQQVPPNITEKNLLFQHLSAA